MEKAKLEHGHDHKHEHSQDCECKHCHSHEQNCDHEHDHDHDHDYKHEHVNNHALNLSPDPAVFSESYELAFLRESSTVPVQEALVHWIEEILKWVGENRGYVGHIKVFIEGTESLWLSSTGKSINIRTSSGWNKAKLKRVNINLTAIILGVTKASLDEYARYSLKYSVERKCLESTLRKIPVSK